MSMGPYSISHACSAHQTTQYGRVSRGKNSAGSTHSTFECPVSAPHSSSLVLAWITSFRASLFASIQLWVMEREGKGGKYSSRAGRAAKTSKAPENNSAVGDHGCRKSGEGGRKSEARESNEGGVGRLVQAAFV